MNTPRRCGAYYVDGLPFANEGRLLPNDNEVAFSGFWCACLGEMLVIKRSDFVLSP